MRYVIIFMIFGWNNMFLAGRCKDTKRAKQLRTV